MEHIKGITIERYIKEYASAKIKDIKNNELMREEHKAEKITQIRKALQYRKTYLITVDEAIRAILEA